MTILNNDNLRLSTSPDPDNGPVIAESSKLTSADGLTLHFHTWRGPTPPNKVLMVVHGMGGHGAYYAAAIAPYLVPQGTAVYAVDLRGHGLSDGVRGDITDFDLFQLDLEVAMREVRRLHPDLPLFMLGESMGTSIAINYVIDAPAETRPDFLALIACVVAPLVKPRPDEILRTVYYFVKDRQRVALPTTGREEQGIRDLEFIKVLKSDPLFNRKVSVRFLTKLTGHMRRAHNSPLKLTLPVFIAQGGRDITVNRRRTRAFMDKIAASDKEIHIFPAAFHALLNDPDAPQVRERLVAWMERQRENYYR